MRILVLLMFLVMLFSMGMSSPDHDGDAKSLKHEALLKQEQERWAELVESASPACQEIAAKLQECKFRRGTCMRYENDIIHRSRFFQPVPRARWPRRCVYYISACDSAGVSVEKYLLCERKETQCQLQEIQDQLQEMQEPASGVTNTTERRKLRLGGAEIFIPPLYLSRAIKKALQELRESQCQKGEDGDA